MMAAPYHTHRRVLLGVPDGTPLCAECGEVHDRKGQRLCRKHHNAYQSEWKKEQARLAREAREFHVKKSVSGETK
jgi:hypothetical protein